MAGLGTKLDIHEMREKAGRIRATCVQMAHDARQGHLGSAMSCVELIVGLFYHWLRMSPDRMNDETRDRFIMSKGHGCTSLYAAMADLGFFPLSWLGRYHDDYGPLPNHPCVHSLPALDFSSGSLGHGLGVATGMAYGFKLRKNPARVAVLMSDGECNEGAVWESTMFAAAQKLDNVLAVVDYNGIQAVGRSDTIMGGTSLEEKFRAFGWACRTIDGNNLDEVVAALERFAVEPGKPTCIVGKTFKGAGVSFMRDTVLWHYRVPSDEDLQKALAEIGCKPLHKEQP